MNIIKARHNVCTAPERVYGVAPLPAATVTVAAPAAQLDRDSDMPLGDEGRGLIDCSEGDE